VAGAGASRRPTLIALIVSFAFFMQQLDGTVIATALPQMARTFGETPLNVSIGVTAYLLTLAVFIPSSSWAADRWGSRTIFGAAIVVFTIGSILCGISNSLLAFVSSRILQAIGGAMMLPVGRLAVLRTAEKHELIKVMQYITIPGLIAPVLGPPLGGFITTFASWRWIFFLNIPIGVLGVILVFTFMPNHRPDERRPFDTKGFFLSGIGLASVMYGFTLLGREDGYWLTTVLFLVCGGGLVALALRHARSHPTPLLDLEPMKIRTYMIATMSGGGLYRMIISSTLFLWPLMFQVGFGLSAFVSGLLVMATAAGDFLGQLFVRPMIRRFGFRPMMLVACVATTMLIFVCALFTHQTPLMLIGVVLLIIGLFRSLQFTAMNTLAYSDIPQPNLSAASTLSSTLQQLAQGVGVAFGAFALNSIAFVHGDAGHALRTLDFQLALAVIGSLGITSTLIFSRLPRDAGIQMTRKPA
jgi:EmrB/QacA subfamily drug resistance transporter